MLKKLIKYFFSILRKEESGICKLREIVENIKPRYLNYASNDFGSEEAQHDHLFNFESHRSLIEQKSQTYFQYLLSLQKSMLFI